LFDKYNIRSDSEIEVEKGYCVWRNIQPKDKFTSILTVEVKTLATMVTKKSEFAISTAVFRCGQSRLQGEGLVNKLVKSSLFKAGCHALPPITN
jgi:hypothetical protein